MTVFAGRDLLLKIRTAPGDDYVSIAGMRVRRLRFNAGALDITNAGSDGRWRNFLGDAAPRDMRLDGEGLFTNDASDRLVRAALFSGAVADCQAVLPGFGRFTGHFLVVSLNYSGAFDGEILWQMSLQSSGIVRFAAA